MAKSKVTIYDIARMAGVSPSAVSLVLNDKPNVSEATRELVKKIIEENNYTPNLNSRKLILKKSFNIFVVVESCFASFDDMFYNSSIIGILELCRKYNYLVVLSDISKDYASSSLRLAVEQKNIDGAIFLQDIRPETATALKEANCPFVVLDAHECKRDIPCVYSDYSEAVKQGINYLLSCGHRRISLIAMDRIPAFYMSVMKGYLAALESAGLRCRPEWITQALPEKNSVSQAVDKLLSCDERPDSMFCSMDIIGIYAIQVLSNRGLSVPTDISVCSVDNIVSSQYCCPSLTTVNIEKKEMGRIAVQMLYDILMRTPGNQSPNHVCAPIGETIIRESVAVR